MTNPLQGCCNDKTYEGTISASPDSLSPCRRSRRPSKEINEESFLKARLGFSAMAPIFYTSVWDRTAE